MKDKIKELVVIHIDNLTPFQDNLKTIGSKTKELLMNSLIRQDYCAPLVVWQCKEDDQNYILDGHQRFLALLEMRERGIKFDFNLTCVLVECKDHDDARKKLLTLASSFGKASKEGFVEFLEEHKLNKDEIDFNFPEIDLSGDVFEEDKDELIFLRVQCDTKEEYDELYAELVARGLKIK